MKALIDMTIPLDSHPLSINHAIKQAHISQRMRRRLRTDGVIHINGQEKDWHTLLQAGDHLTIVLPPEQTLEPYALPLSIVFEDDYLVVINKPAGLLMHPTSTERHKTLANALAHYYAESGQSYDFHPVHRLDKDTSGLVIVAKTAVVQHAFSKQATKFQKVYDAIVTGHLPGHADLHWPIARKEGSIIERCVHSTGKEAHTDVQKINNYQSPIQLSRRLLTKTCNIAQAPGTPSAKALCTPTYTDTYTHVRCLLHTGRTHQIRVHLSHLGYPLLGDDIYGGGLELMERQALHASQLSFIHPMTQEELHLEGPLPKDMAQLL